MTAPAIPPAAHGAPLLRVAGLRFSYGLQPLLDGLTLDFGPGFVWLKGGNGSGKSTLLKLLAGALVPLAGRIEVQGLDRARQPLDCKRRVFWCGPGPLPFDHLSPLEYFGFMQGLYPLLDRHALEAHAQGFGLQAHLYSALRSLSTGTQRKVWLAAALAANTPVTLLDEPLNALDAASLEHLRDSLSRAKVAPSRLWIVANHEDFGPACVGAAVLDLTR